MRNTPATYPPASPPSVTMSKIAMSWARLSNEAESETMVRVEETLDAAPIPNSAENRNNAKTKFVIAKQNTAIAEMKCENRRIGFLPI